MGFVVVASNAGAGSDPAWWRNLEAEPRATVRVGRGSVAVTARQLDGEDRDRAWRDATRANPGYERYRASTSRRIPVVLLEHRSD